MEADLCGRRILPRSKDSLALYTVGRGLHVVVPIIGGLGSSKRRDSPTGNHIRKEPLGHAANKELKLLRKFGVVRRAASLTARVRPSLRKLSTMHFRFILWRSAIIQPSSQQFNCDAQVGTLPFMYPRKTAATRIARTWGITLPSMGEMVYHRSPLRPERLNPTFLQ